MGLGCLISSTSLIVMADSCLTSCGGNGDGDGTGGDGALGSSTGGGVGGALSLLAMRRVVAPEGLVVGTSDAWVIVLGNEPETKVNFSWKISSFNSEAILERVESCLVMDTSADTVTTDFAGTGGAGLGAGVSSGRGAEAALETSEVPLDRFVGSEFTSSVLFGSTESGGSSTSLTAGDLTTPLDDGGNGAGGLALSEI